ncbi:hypothetical protein ACFXPZ_14105 [Streptomyces sp. NPDC059101]|uniref:hypothetical protein n=1 Tax=Streptomyces sp. NPDC059101 TaxID=3346728 RepID=UPI003686B2BF
MQQPFVDNCGSGQPDIKIILLPLFGLPWNRRESHLMRTGVILRWVRQAGIEKSLISG